MSEYIYMYICMYMRVVVVVVWAYVKASAGRIFSVASFPLPSAPDFLFCS